jgi:hypothetical protein
MIVRTVGAMHYLIAQREHARQSAVLTAALDTEWLGGAEEAASVIRATAAHDDGWAEWREQPRFARNGLPVNFDNLEADEHEAIWQRSIFSALHQLGPAEAAIIARHSLALLKHTDEDSRSARADLVKALALRAWPESLASARVEQGFAALLLGDLLSLLAAAGWSGRHTVELHGYGERRLPVECWRDDEWTVRVNPWPFPVPELRNVHLDAVAIPVGEEATCAERLAQAPSNLIRVAVDYLPMEGTS